MFSSLFKRFDLPSYEANFSGNMCPHLPDNVYLWYIAAMAINLKTVIFELQFLAELAADNPHDPRIRDLVNGVKADFATALQGVTGDDPIPGGGKSAT